MASEQFSLCWDNFHKNMSSGMNSLLENEDLVDVTLAVEGKYLKAHKMVLSVCSPYFKELFKSNPCQHPIVFMKDVSYVAISDLLQFMYQGEVQVSQDNLTTFIKTAEALQIKGLTGDGNGSTDADSEPVVEKPSTRHVEETYKPSPRPKKQLPAPVVTTTPAPKRPRLSVSSNDSQSTPAPITKTEPVSTPVSGGDSAPVQFKVEPYDQNQSVTIPDDTGDDNFGDDTLDDNMVDDTEDYSMMEGEEPQAGTSTDGTGEGQGVESLPHYPRVAQLWEFLQVLLNDSSEYYSDIIRWQNSFEGIFKIVDSARLAELWGQHKNLTGMTYDKMSRSLRNYYKTNKLKKVTGQRQVYQFIFSEKNPPFKSTHLSPKISRLIEETDSFKVKNNALYQEKLEIMHKNLQTFLGHRNPRRSDIKNTVPEKASLNPATASSGKSRAVVKDTDLATDIEVKEETQIE